VPDGGLAARSDFQENLGIIERLSDDCPTTRTGLNAAPVREVLHSLMLGALVEGKRFNHVRWVMDAPTFATLIGQEPIMAWHEAAVEKRPQYLFKLKQTNNVRRVIAWVTWSQWAGALSVRCPQFAQTNVRLQAGARNGGSSSRARSSRSISRRRICSGRRPMMERRCMSPCWSRRKRRWNKWHYSTRNGPRQIHR